MSAPLCIAPPGKACRGIVLAVLVGLATNAVGFQSLRGPSFLNASGAEIEIYVSTVSKGEFHLLTNFAPGPPVIMRDGYELTALKVIASGHTFEFGGPELTAQRGSMKPHDQLWVFDGERICVVRHREPLPKRCP